MSGLDKRVNEMGRMMRKGCLLKSCLGGDGKFSGINGVKIVADLVSARAYREFASESIIWGISVSG
jgi:hypothetical protein